MNHNLLNQLAKARHAQPPAERAAHEPHQLGAWSAFTVVAGVVLLALFASATPSPLYADYAARWHFSTPMLTVVFAAYAFGALTALLLVGRLSDDLGRRPLLAAGLAVLLGAMLLFALARSVEWLLAARLVKDWRPGPSSALPRRHCSSSNRAETPAEPALSMESALRSGVVASWSIAGLYLALAPSLAANLLGTDSHLAGGVAVFALGASAGVGQVVFRSLSPRQATAAGSLALAAGMASTVASIPADSGALFLAGSVIAGAGWGVAFMGAIRSISAAAPAKHRAGVMAAFYVVAYLALSVPAVIAGLAVPGLGIEPTFRIFGVAVIVLALLTAAGTRRSARITRVVQAYTK